MAYETEGNLQHAFGGESMANRRYIFFAEKAEKEGYPGVARLFRAVAEAETVHARNHMLVMDAIGSTRENLLAASIGEHQEFTRMYPLFIDKAKEERLNVVIAGHIASDTLGMNLLLDSALRGKVDIIDCSGFTRVARKAGK